jgi:hypothetical protein
VTLAELTVPMLIAPAAHAAGDPEVVRLVALAREGDRAAFGRLIEAHLHAGEARTVGVRSAAMIEPTPTGRAKARPYAAKARPDAAKARPDAAKARPDAAKARPYAANVGSHFSATGVDEAIDRVAAKMVAMDEADILPAVMARLPARAATPWFMAMPVQLAAAAALVVIAFLSARPSREVKLPESLPVMGQTSIEWPSLDATPALVAALTPDPRSPIPDSRPLLRQGFGGQAPIPEDHEFGLAPVPAIHALELDEIAPAAMELDAASSLAPLVLADLALDTQGDR